MGRQAAASCSPVSHLAKGETRGSGLCVPAKRSGTLVGAGEDWRVGECQWAFTPAGPHSSLPPPPLRPPYFHEEATPAPVS